MLANQCERQQRTIGWPVGFLTTAASIAILLGPAMGIQAATNILIKQTLVAHKPLKPEMPAGLTACGHLTLIHI